MPSTSPRRSVRLALVGFAIPASSWSARTTSPGVAFAAREEALDRAARHRAHDLGVGDLRDATGATVPRRAAP